MKDPNFLFDKLVEYSQTDYYPFHMPGHKRRAAFPNPYDIDVTEIKGFDNLHHAEGILRESMDFAASVYGADRTYYLVNGSSCGILSAICGTTSFGGKILMARNCHKSAYHGVFLNHLNAEYIYPQFVDDFWVYCGLFTENIEEIVDKHDDIEALLVVSPTYEGIVSDIERISQIAHKKNIPLIVDEAHGAHFCFGEDFPKSALEMGADIVIQSIHKTLPCFTQTALLHVKKGFVDPERIERYLQIFQSSSPSYVFMAGIEQCIRYMDSREGRQRMEQYGGMLRAFMKASEGFKHLRVMGDEIIGSMGVVDRDRSKIVISTEYSSIDGVRLSEMLRKEYHLELEMGSRYYGLAMTSVMDTQDGFDRLYRALREIDGRIGGNRGDLNDKRFVYPDTRMGIADALDSKQNKEKILFHDSEGRISAEFITVYPPGIPAVVPGEVLTRDMISLVEYDRAAGLSVEGMQDDAGKSILVVRKD